MAINDGYRNLRVIILGDRNRSRDFVSKYYLLDPEGFVSHGDELMIIDEVQRSPSLLQAVKKNVDENKNYGRFLLTGSANILSGPTAQESLAGRVTHIRLRPLSMGEINHKDPDFVENAFNGKLYATMPDKHYCKDDYLRLALIGGYPAP